MAASYSGLFPFDGTCRVSSDANLTLTFNSESKLEVDKDVVARASHILKAMIEKSEYEGMLFLGSDDRQAWLLMLHFLHPQGVSLMFEQMHAIDIGQLVSKASIRDMAVI